MAYKLETRIEIWDDRTGAHLSIGSGEQGGIEIVDVSSAGVRTDVVTFVAAQIPFIIEALEKFKLV